MEVSTPARPRGKRSASWPERCGAIPATDERVEHCPRRLAGKGTTEFILSPADNVLTSGPPEEHGRNKFVLSWLARVLTSTISDFGTTVKASVAAPPVLGGRAALPFPHCQKEPIQSTLVMEMSRLSYGNTSAAPKTPMMLQHRSSFPMQMAIYAGRTLKLRSPCGLKRIKV